LKASKLKTKQLGTYLASKSLLCTVDLY